MSKLEGDERYKITDKKAGVIHKIDRSGKPDFDGVTYCIIEELETGYTVYAVSDIDLSQPSVTYFIAKGYVEAE